MRRRTLAADMAAHPQWWYDLAALLCLLAAIIAAIAILILAGR